MKLRSSLKEKLIDLYVLLTPKNTIEEKEFVDNGIKLKSKDLVYTIQHGVVAKINAFDEPIWFRRCSFHTPIRRYIKDFTDYFFHKIKNDEHEYQLFLKYAMPCLSIKKNLKRIMRMGSITEASPLYFFIKGTYGSDSIGLEGADSIIDKKTLKEWALYASAQILAYRYNRFSLKNGIQTYFVLNDIAYRKVAELLQLEEMIPNCYLARVKIDDDYYYGCLSENAPGLLASKIDQKQRESMISGEMQRQLTELNILDYICNVYDHGPYNYNVVFGDDLRINNLYCFDNDSIGGFPPRILSRIRIDQSSLIKNGMFNRPYLGKGFFDNLKIIKKNEVYKALKTYLPKSRIDGVCCRMEKIVSSISKALNAGKTRLLSNEEWNRQTINNELCGNYPKSYLKSFVSFEHKEPI